MNTFIALLLASSSFCCTYASSVDSVLNSNGLFNAFSALTEDGVLDVLNDKGAVSKAFSAFSQQFDKSDNADKLDVFQANLKKIASHNLNARKSGGFEKGVNQFSDLTYEETVQQFTGYKKSNKTKGFSSLATPQKPPLAKKWSTPPASLDWRTYKMVSPVKNQAGCGSCVFFATTGTHESSHALFHNGEILDLSEQELIDCARGDGNNGCQGGTFVPTFKYLTSTGQSLEAEYAYTGSDSDGWDQAECKAAGLNHPSKLTGWWPVKPATDEKALLTAVANYGPVSVAICVNDDFVRYKRGVLDTDCNCGRNHAVVVVGYGSEGGKDFWIVKNSWGEGFGEGGYIKMRRNKKNMCDIAGDAVFVNA
ncbi:cathepsin L1 [Folsomia candida]|uniref:cathepsin L1 n=1 Tax=Folsomia candida TaxID=158441 RepID=UPI001604E9FC|nr:cathepsin L1 [Folsomia candida]